MAVLQVDDQVVFQGRTATFSAVVRDVRRAAGRPDTAVVLRPVYTLPKRHFPAGDVAVVIDLAGRTWRGVIGGSTDQAVAVLLQQVETTGDRVDLRLARADLLSKAKLAKSFEDFDVMLSTVNALGYLHQDLSEEEMEFTISSYHFLADKHFTILKELCSANFADTPDRVIHEFYETVKHRLLKHCTDCIKYTEEHLIPFASLQKRAVYYRMIGDFSWLAFDHIDGFKDMMLTKAVGSYELGISVLEHCRCVPGDATYLGLVLNLSVILHGLLNSPDRACSIALGAVNAISAELLSPESTTTYNLIKENLRIWSSHNEDAAADNLPVMDGALPVGENANEEAMPDHLGAMVGDPDVEDVAAAYALQNGNGAADNHLDRFEEPPLEWEKPGNSRHGKNFRDERKRKCEQRGRFG